ncbi:hypothetical protein [Nostoc commune]|uniref:hypothetical protein n=1 Tax=Nostoc commune TaxID=1178 RepID=UPI0020738443|nr:hypothetical protein [Nostoc commune]
MFAVANFLNKFHLSDRSVSQFSGCRDLALLRLYKDFGIMQNHFHTWNQQRHFFAESVD